MHARIVTCPATDAAVPRQFGCISIPNASSSVRSEHSGNAGACHSIRTHAACRGTPIVAAQLRHVAAHSSFTCAASSQHEQVALEGDLVYCHFDCRDETGEIVDSSRNGDGLPISFEVGAGEVFTNPMLKTFDGAVRGLAVGDVVRIQAVGGDWKPELLFEVPRDHPEIARLEGRYKNVGGLAVSLVVELANGSQAVVLEMNEAVVKLDANSMLAGKQLVFELQLLKIIAAEMADKLAAKNVAPRDITDELA